MPGDCEDHLPNNPAETQPGQTPAAAVLSLPQWTGFFFFPFPALPPEFLAQV